MKQYRQYVQSDKMPWSIVAVPSQAWADMVFADAKEEERVALLWDAIFKATRIDQENPVAAWQAHNEKLHTKVDYLNKKKKELEFESDLPEEFSSFIDNLD